MERSAAHSLARQGDTGAARDFVDRRLVGDDECETANLNYWAYWLEEIRGPKLDDSFMVETSIDSWRGARLARHLARKRYASNRYLDLDVHSLWALPQRKPGVLREEADVLWLVKTAVEQLLDEVNVSGARGELESMLFGIRMMDG